jgi:hypothetical protein
MNGFLGQTRIATRANAPQIHFVPLGHCTGSASTQYRG